MKFFPWVALLVATPLLQAAERVVQYKTGIDLLVEGKEGSDYAVEWWYHDPKIYPRKVVYIKDSTKIGFAHNERNIARSLAGAEDLGQIRYRIDGDMNIARTWLTEAAYSQPFAFKELDYGAWGDSGTPVVGTVGPKPGIEATGANKATYYHRGLVDSAGDEWHALSVGDDDSGFISSAGFQNEGQASDGVVILFVVNPKTPCLTIQSEGNAEFYTTPAKNYHVPKIHDQTTYVAAREGKVVFRLRDLHGGNIFYRIVGEGARDGDFISAGKPEVVLSDADFKKGTSLLEYYLEGREKNRKVRRVVKDPGFPSAREAHGDRFWGGPGNWDSVREKIARHGAWWMDQWRKQESNNNLTRIASFGAGRRTSVGTGISIGAPNALLLRHDGVTAKRSATATLTFADYALKALLETAATIDPVGFEKRHSGSAIPSPELAYRGYYDVNDIYDAAFTYDIVAGYFRSDQHPRGMTPVQDHLIRDMLATYVLLSNLELGLWGGPEAKAPAGMWDVARRTGAYIVMCVMPGYSTPYLGTSGLDGNTAAHPWTPFPDDRYTWKRLFVDDNVPLKGFPNVARRFGIADDNVSSDGHFVDRLSYASVQLMGHCFVALANMQMIHNPKTPFKYLDLFFERSANGTLMGLKDGAGPAFRANAGILNAFYPEVREVAVPRMLALDSTHGESLGKQLQRGGPFYVLWYNHDLQPGMRPPNVSPPARPGGLRVIDGN